MAPSPLSLENGAISAVVRKWWQISAVVRKMVANSAVVRKMAAKLRCRLKMAQSPLSFEKWR